MKQEEKNMAIFTGAGVHPINSDFRKRIEDAVLETYDAQKETYLIENAEV